MCCLIRCGGRVMRKNHWMLGVLCILFCAAVVMVEPTQARAAGQSDRDAYRTVFDASYYYNAYPDVAAAYGMDESALFAHFVNYGVYEGRSGSAEYNPQAYRARYTDLQEAFGDDMAAYCRHYVSYGRAEGRIASGDGQAAVPVRVSVKANNVPTVKSAPAEEGETAEQSGTENTSEQPAEGTGTENKPEQSAEGSGQTVVGTCTTSYEANIPRAVNVELAAQRVDGVVVQPGGTFSFSKTILDRTSANGYVEAPIFISGKKGTGIGGGVCQVSSTLYAAMVYGGLPATERHAHSLPVDYLPQGLDATIAGNYMDLRFTNIYTQPLLIQASAANGTLTVTLVLQ